MFFIKYITYSKVISKSEKKLPSIRVIIKKAGLYAIEIVRLAFRVTLNMNQAAYNKI